MGRNSILYQNEFTGLFFLRGGGERKDKYSSRYRDVI